MPAVSKAQQALMGADLARARAGKKTRTGMNVKQLEEFARIPHKKLPKRVRTSRRKRSPSRGSRQRGAA